MIGGHIRRSPLYSAYLWLRTPSASAIPRPIFMAEAVSSSGATATLQPTTIVCPSVAFRSLYPRLLCFLDRCSRFRNRERNRLARGDRSSREKILIRWKWAKEREGSQKRGRKPTIWVFILGWLSFSARSYMTPPSSLRLENKLRRWHLACLVDAAKAITSTIAELDPANRPFIHSMPFHFPTLFLIHLSRLVNDRCPMFDVVIHVTLRPQTTVKTNLRL